MKASATVIEQMAKELSHLKIDHVNSSFLQQFHFSAPYMIMLETCRQEDGLYQTCQISPEGAAFSRYDEKRRQHLVNRPLHRHSFLEILYVIRGSVTNRIEDQVFTYTEGQCCIMNRNICHCEIFEGNYQAAFLMLQDDFLKEILDVGRRESAFLSPPSGPQPVLALLEDGILPASRMDKIYLDCFPADPQKKPSCRLSFLLDAVLRETLQREAGFLPLVSGLFARMFYLLDDPTCYSVRQVSSQASRQEYLVCQILHLLETDPKAASHSQLTRRLHYSGEYLNRIFKKYTGKTISEYRQQLVLRQAARLLAGTDRSISGILSDLGVSNRSYFYRAFETAYGMTPLAYRKSSAATGLHKSKSSRPGNGNMVTPER